MPNKDFKVQYVKSRKGVGKKKKIPENRRFLNVFFVFPLFTLAISHTNLYMNENFLAEITIFGLKPHFIFN